MIPHFLLAWEEMKRPTFKGPLAQGTFLPGGDVLLAAGGPGRC